MVLKIQVTDGTISVNVVDTTFAQRIGSKLNVKNFVACAAKVKIA